MSITITSQTTLQDIKTVFNQKFSGLKIDFFVDVNADGNYTANEQIKDYSSTLSDLGAKRTDGHIAINEQSTVAEVEAGFLELFGVVAQVFRRRGNTWLMTSATDTYTLQELNQMGLESLENRNTDDPINAADRQELE